MKIDIHTREGSKKGTRSVDAGVFGIEPNVAVMHQSVKMHLANRRQGTHKTKERSEVSGGGRKPWRQKGRGVARAGTIRSPLWVGGGTIFGPRPHEYRQAMPKKMRRLARRSALSLKMAAGEVTVVDDLKLDQIRTKDFAAILSSFGLAGRKTLVLVSEPYRETILSARNIERCSINVALNASTYELLNNQAILIEESALAALESLLGEEESDGTEVGATATDVDPVVEEEVSLDEPEAGDEEDDNETESTDSEEK